MVENDASEEGVGAVLSQRSSSDDRDYLTLLWFLHSVKPINNFFTRNWIGVFDFVTVRNYITHYAGVKDSLPAHTINEFSEWMLVSKLMPLILQLENVAFS